jgi:hypothetical protein
MRKTLVITGIAALLMLAGGRAEALTLMPTGTTCTSTTNLNLAEIYLRLDQCFGVDIPEEDFGKLYKADGVEEGAYATFYTTSLSSTPPAIQHVGSEEISCFECYLVVKGGNTRYFFDLSGWNGTETISLSGWQGPTYGAVSSVSIYGVPEPATALLLAMGLGVVAVRKRRQIA